MRDDARGRRHREPSDDPVQTAGLGTPSPRGEDELDRGVVIGGAMAVTARWAWRFIIVSVAVAILLWLLSRLWVGIFPVMLALIVSTVLAGPVGWMRRRGVPSALAAGLTLVLAVLLVLGTLAAIAPSIIAQTGDVVDRASQGIVTVREWLAGPPVNLDNEQLDNAIKEATNWLQERSSDIASGVFTGVSAVTSALVTLALVLVLTFFFIKDGPGFLPWLRRVSGHTAGQHLTEILTRAWRTLGGFIRTQAVVSAVDAFFIGLGLVILGVPLAPALAVLTFMAGFIPIVGAFVAGTLAVLVALVSNGWVTALWVLGIVLLVQQVEGNVLQPLLQSRSMQMHPVIILLSVAAGGTLFGIPGAFLAVPVAATVVVALRYLSEQVDLRTGDLHPEDLTLATPEGAITARDGERAGERNRRLLHEPGAEPGDVVASDEIPETRRRTGSPVLGRLRSRVRRQG
ncbi:AI-2E family transporter [Ornithinimicrobium cavernae]|uniref:AI-2E family transporter n=1 Tax=Ornithinimicrobium cavernae TaxID=2666047 RepID=UPI001F21E12D|nr:AI-2E family transporter [Ornithinimicrobium cavernae]